jgi:hypothetical protein
MNQIDTASALARLNDTWDESLSVEKTYGLRFITEKGFREIYNARKGVKFAQQKGKPNDTNRGKSNKKFSGLVQVYDNDLKQFRDIFFDCIVAFRDYKDSKWIRIRLT